TSPAARLAIRDGDVPLTRPALRYPANPRMRSHRPAPSPTTESPTTYAGEGISRCSAIDRAGPSAAARARRVARQAAGSHVGLDLEPNRGRRVAGRLPGVAD